MASNKHNLKTASGLVLPLSEEVVFDHNALSANNESSLIPIVAIGASVGDLEPIDAFFAAIPTDLDCAFVIVQHLSANSCSTTGERLARHGEMKVFGLDEDTIIQPNAIYLNLPSTLITVEGNQLLVANHESVAATVNPIDYFFTSLASSRADKSIAVVLSGTGSDGTAGSMEVESSGGQVFIQDPELSELDDMPRSVVDSGRFSFMGAPALLADQVNRVLRNETARAADKYTCIADATYPIFSLFRQRHGTDFNQYKDAIVQRRIERRVRLTGFTDINDYLQYFFDNENEQFELYADLLIEKAEFFRDQEAFDALEVTAISKLVERCKTGGSIRIWVPGCASGEEAYSIAILLLEKMSAVGVDYNFKVIATDIHSRSRKQASSGVYDQLALKNIPSELIAKYFDCSAGQARVKPLLRNKVFFSTHDVTRDLPFARIDLISCRNLLIYLKDEIQDSVLQNLSFALLDEGYLFLGSSESTGNCNANFKPVNERWHIYQKCTGVNGIASGPRVPANVTAAIIRAGSLSTEYPIHNSGNEHNATFAAIGEQSLPVGQSANEPDRIGNTSSVEDKLSKQGNDKNNELYSRISTLETELQYAEEILKLTIDQLQSTNEELMATNEELHSVNEELFSINTEIHSKNEELTDRETDIDVLLKESKIGTLHLDRSLTLVRYSSNARSLFNILPEDIGRPISDLTVRVEGEKIYELIDKANRNNETHELRVRVGQNVYLVRILPYAKVINSKSINSQDENNSVIITVIDITDAEHAREKIADLDSRYSNIMEQTQSFIVNWRADDDKILFCNEAFARRWSSTVQEMVGKNIVNIREEQERADFKQSIVSMVPDEHTTEAYSHVHDGRKRFARVSTRAISKDGIKIDEYQTIGFDCTDEYSYRAALDDLFAVFSDESLKFNERMELLLDVGLSYFELETAMVVFEIGATHEVKFIKTHAKLPYERGELIPRNNAISSVLVNTNSATAIDDISKTEYASLECYNVTGVQSHIGSAIHTDIGPYGAVSFSSQSSRGREFNQQEHDFALLMGNWIGFLVGTDEQYTLISNLNDYYKSLFNTVPVMMFLTDPDGLIISVSKSLCNKFGFHHDAIPGKICFNLFDTPNKQAFVDAITLDHARQVPLSIRKSNGELMDVELNCSVKASGSLKGIRMVVMNDVSERNRAAHQIEEQNRRLEAANVSLNQFAFVASHDLQEPLRKIQQFGGLLEEELEGIITEDGQYHLNTIVGASERMSVLINDLLAFSRTSQEKPKMENVSLVTLLDEVLEGLDISIEESQAKIKIGNLPNVMGDKSLLRQLFTNLVGNGIKYRSKERPIEITIGCVTDDSTLGVSITDNGIGFDMKYVKTIFEPFNRLHRGKEYKGSGIGLAICSAVCEKHGWTLSATSECNVGSTFTVTFARP